jgi:flagellin-like protein
MKSKKGITPIIAVILLLMMTVAGAGAAFFWFVRIQSEMQGGTESYSEQLSEKIAARVDISEIDYIQGGGDANLTIIVRNNGNVPVSLTDSETTFILKDYNNNIICNSKLNGSDAEDAGDVFCMSGCSGTLDIKSAQELKLAVNDTGGPCYINPATYGNDTVFTIKMDFAGVAASGGQFTS